MPGLNIGVEQEFKNIYLVSYRSSKLVGFFTRPEEAKNTRNEKMSYELRTIAYGMPVAKAAGAVKVSGAKLPMLKIESEGADPKKHQIPEMIGAPVKVGSTEFDAHNEAVKFFKQAVDTSLRGTPDFHWDMDNGTTVQFFKLKRVLALYNSLLDTYGHVSRREVLQGFKLQETRDGSWGWAIGRKGVKPVTGADPALQTAVQVNFEVPFRKIGQPNGMPLKNFGSAEQTFVACQEEAKTIVDELCAAYDKTLKTAEKDFDTSRLRSLFTLYFYGLCVHWENANRTQVAQKANSAEAAATANKSAWEVLPKVRWSDIWKNALTDGDRKRIPTSGGGWSVLLDAMNLRLEEVSRKSARPNMQELAPFRTRDDKHELHKPWLTNYHEKLFRAQEGAFSSTGKPLPVGKAQIEGVSEPLIVFEVRRSGAEFNKAMSDICNKQVSSEKFVAMMVDAQTI
jgi:hypothetical protein